MRDPDPPSLTVRVPGRSAAPAELLTAGPPELVPGDRRTRLSRRLRAPVAVVLLVLAVGAAALDGHGAPAAPRPPAALPSPVAVPDVVARAALGPRRADLPYVERVVLSVELIRPDGRAGSRARGAGEQVVLLDVAAPGFSLRLDGRSVPIVLGRTGRAASPQPAVPLPADLVVTDCAVDPRAQRQVLVLVRQGEEPARVVGAEVDPGVVRALDRLVSRTCRRPRG